MSFYIYIYFKLIKTYLHSGTCLKCSSSLTVIYYQCRTYSEAFAVQKCRHAPPAAAALLSKTLTLPREQSFVSVTENVYLVHFTAEGCTMEITSFFIACFIGLLCNTVNAAMNLNLQFCFYIFSIYYNNNCKS